MNWLLWNRGRLMEDAGGGDAGGGGGGGSAGGTTLFGAAGGDGAQGQGQQGGQQGGGSSSTATSTWFKDDAGAFADGWTSRFDGDLKDHPSLKPIGSVIDLAKSYVETKKLIGTKLEMPGENATPEQWASWRKVTGAPDAPEGYLGDAKTLRPEGVPETMWDAEGEKAFLALAHKHGLPPAAVKDIIAFHAQSFQQGIAKYNEDHEAHLQAEESKLKQEWGGQFEGNMTLAKRAALTAGLDPVKNPIFKDSAVVMAFAKLGRLFNETSLVPGDTGGSAAGGLTARIQEIQDPKSQAMLAREYRGEFGPERQTQAANALRSLLKAQAEQK